MERGRTPSGGGAIIQCVGEFETKDEVRLYSPRRERVRSCVFLHVSRYTVALFGFPAGAARAVSTLRKTYSVQERRQTTPCGRLNSQHFRCKKQDLTYLSRHSRPPPRPCSLSSIVSLYILYCKPRGAPPATRHNRAHYINADQRGRSCRPDRSEADRRDRTIDRTSGLGPSHPPAAKGGKRYAVSTPVMCRHRRWAVPGGRTEREVEEKNGRDRY